MRSQSLVALTAFLFTSTSLPAAADDIETVVVSATRTEQPQARTGESVSVLDAATLRTLQTVSLTDALRLVPGVVISQSGDIGQPATASIRGAETGQTLVLIDGVRISDPSGTDDGAILADVLVNNTDRVEILRGPQSALYGSDAIGGVIDILSMRGGETPFALTASAEGGSLDTYHLNAAANGTAGAVEYGAAANFLHTNGISAADRRNGNRETDGYGNFGATANTRIHVSDAMSMDLRGYYTNARDDFDDNSGFSPPFPPADSFAYNRNRLLAGYAGLNFDLFNGVLHNRISATATNSNRSFFNSFFDLIPGQRDSENKGASTRFEYQGTADISPNDQLVFGAEDERTRFSSVGTFNNDRGHGNIYSFYGQYQKTLFNTVTLTAGVRYDRHDQFGSHTSLKFAAAWQPADGTVVHANYGDGFKAPSLYELFSQFGTPGLKPETARGWEAGAEQAFFSKTMHASITYFSRNTRNLIDFQSCFVATPPAQCAVQPFGFYFNIDSTRVTGIEAEVAGNITDALNVSLDYTNMDAKDRMTGLALNRRPRNTASAVVNWSQADWGVGASLSYVGRQVDQYDTSTVPPTPFINAGHTTVTLLGHYDFEQWSIYGRIENLFAEHYEPVLGYGAPGRTYFAGIRFTE
ncbi:MAG TPA: TonB-dependent receptor [Rhizomicrobium sp.]|nr:TonB-dependent receptor [Rhizomicrobium sp.]